MSITYGLAIYDRFTAIVECDSKLPMDNVKEANLQEFLESAGQNDWELCAAFPIGIVGVNRALPGTAKTRKCEDAAEEIAFVFKRV